VSPLFLISGMGHGRGTGYNMVVVLSARISDQSRFFLPDSFIEVASQCGRVDQEVDMALILSLLPDLQISCWVCWFMRYLLLSPSFYAGLIYSL
jgi:hypothetical protein